MQGGSFSLVYAIPACHETVNGVESVGGEGGGDHELVMLLVDVLVQCPVMGQSVPPVHLHVSQNQNWKSNQ